MDSVQAKLIERLGKHFPDLNCGLETLDGQVNGWVASSAFEGLDDDVRLERLWETIRAELTEEERAQIGPIVALTPVEAEFDISADSRA